ncbi:recombinase family protein [Neoasaia chiangmaiensis]|nr:recombinase family protein [Neoasaia chiangmaiensis]
MSSDDRLQFRKLLKKIQSGDELVVMKLDRLGRSILDILTD